MPRKKGRSQSDELLLAMLGRQIAAARNLLGMSQDELARRVRTSQNAISLIEGGKSDPGYTTLLRIAEVLDTTLEALREPIPAIQREHEAKNGAHSKKAHSKRGASNEPARQ